MRASLPVATITASGLWSLTICAVRAVFMTTLTPSFSSMFACQARKAEISPLHGGTAAR